MIKKTITYKNLFTEEEVTEDFFFHLSKADMIDLAVDGEFKDRVKRIMEARDNVAIVREFKAMIEKSVGRREGEQFIKTPEFARSFMSSPAFDELIVELMTSPDQGTLFIAGMLPSDAQKEATKEIKRLSEGGTVDEEPAWIRDRRVPSKQEFASATPAQKLVAFQLQVQKGMEPGQDLTGHTES